MDNYPINYHILAEDFREQAAGRKRFTHPDGKWLYDSLHKMCAAYDESGFWVVGITEECKRLAICATQEQAEQYIGTLPNAEDGRYYIDGPCTEPIQLSEVTEKE